MKEYRMLEQGELIKEGDEWVSTRDISWSNPRKVSVSIGCRYDKSKHSPTRRQIEDTTTYSSDTTGVLAKLSGLTDATTSENEFENNDLADVNDTDVVEMQDKPQEWVDIDEVYGCICEGWFLFENGKMELGESDGDSFYPFSRRGTTFRNKGKPIKFCELVYPEKPEIKTEPAEADKKKEWVLAAGNIADGVYGSVAKLYDALLDGRLGHPKESGND